MMEQFTPEQWERIQERIRVMVAGVGGDSGWWEDSNQEPFIELAEEMVKHGFGLTDIQHHFGQIISAMCDEYGE